MSFYRDLLFSSTGLEESTMPTTACPSHAILTDFALGKLAPQILEEIAAHVDGCPDCQAELTMQASEDDTLVGLIRQPVRQQAFEGESGLSRAIGRVLEMGRGHSFSRGMMSKSPSAAVDLGTIGNYRLLTKLGQGGMGAVYKALHTRLEKVVALKVLPADRMQAEAVARFQREVRAVGKLQHPNIVQAFDAGEHEGTHFLVMECVDGVDLSTLVKELGPLSIADACELIRQAAIGLAHAHQHGLVHRDLKPSNLMLARDRQVKLLDLGLALLQGKPEETPELTTACQVMGTADYMAPEQASDSHAVDIRADIYSLGCTLYRLITGEVPYPAPAFKTPLEKLTAHIARAFPEVQSKRSDVPKALIQVLGRMVAKRPEDRYATPAEVAAALAPLAAGSKLGCLVQFLDQRPSGDNAPTLSTTTRVSALADTTTGQPAAGLVKPAPSIESRPPSEVERRLQPAVKTRHASLRRIIIAVAAIALFIAAAIAVIKIQTRDGTLVLTVDGEGAVVTIDGEAANVMLGDDKRTYRVSVQPGTHTLVVTTPDGLRYKADNQFTIESGAQTRLTARLEKPPPVAAAPTIVETTADSDRTAAEWALGVGGSVSIYFDGQSADVRSIVELPNRKFTVGQLRLSQCPIRDADLARLEGLKELKVLDLPAAITDAGLKHFEGLPKLYALTLNGTRITDAAFDSLVKIKTLTHLNIGGTKISSAAWPRLKELPKLTSLAITVLPFTDTDVANLVADQAQLQSLYLAGTKVTDEGLAYVPSLRMLRSLQLANLDVTDAGLTYLHHCETLTTVDLKGTKVTAAGVKSLQAALPKCTVEYDHPVRNSSPAGNVLGKRSDENDRAVALWALRIGGKLTIEIDDQPTNVGTAEQLLPGPFHLTVLNLAGTPVRDHDLARLAGLQHLEDLELHDTGVTDVGLNQLEALPALRRLILYNTKITDAAFNSLSRMQALRQLSLTGTKTTPAGWRRLKELPKLSELHVAMMPLGNSDLAELIAAQPEVETLNLWGTAVSDAGMTHLAKASRLKSLQLNFTKVTGRGLAPLGGLAHLETLELPGQIHFGDEAAKYLSTAPALKTLKLPDVDLTDAGLMFLGKIKSLRELRLGAGKTTSAGLADLVDLPELAALQLQYPRISDEAAAFLAQMRQLKGLELGDVQGDKGLESLSRLQKLEELHLSGGNLTDAGLAHLARMPNLRLLECKDTAFTDAGILALAQAKNLTTLILQSSRITPAGVKALRAALPATDIQLKGINP
jgi:serine/threonine protein kinase/Leucine-rich repeat (LRR) protein